MGRVFVGEHVIMGRRAAIKVLHDASATDPDQVQRLFDEARAACQIAHPAIVEVFDCGTSAFAGPYLVMELLEGESLARALRGNRRPPLPWVASVLAQVADALDAAHRAGIIHRDLKPGNIFLLSDGRLKLLDFGIARLSENQSLPPRRVVIGTPRYMAPEQTLGEPATAAADVYALGVIAFEMLTGTLPFTSRDSRELMELHRTAPMPSICDRVPELPSGADQVISQALTKRPKRRFISCGAFSRALLSALGVASTDATWPLAALAWLGSGEPPGSRTPELQRLERPLDIPATQRGPLLRVPTARMRCPRCQGEELKVRAVGETEVDCCRRCGGVWLDAGELDALLALSLGAAVGKSEVLARALPIAAQPAGALRCPACDEPLTRLRIAEAELDLDRCGACDGLWLDGGELAALQRLQAER